MQIVEQEQDRCGLRKPCEQGGHRAVAPVALMRCRRATGRERGERREHPAELRSDVLVQGGKHTRIESLDVFLERVDEHPERQVTLQLRCGPAQYEVTARIGASRELCEESRLPDPGLSHEGDGGTLARIEPGEELVERAELLGAPDEVLGKKGHVLPATRIDEVTRNG